MKILIVEAETEFVDNLFPIINWDNVAERFSAARKFA